MFQLIQYHQRQLVERSDLFYKRSLSSLRRATRAAFSREPYSRKDLNHPPTAVGGIDWFCRIIGNRAMDDLKG